MRIFVDTAINKNDRGREKSNNMRERSWTRRPWSETCCTHEKEKRRDIAQQSTVYRKVYSTVHSTVYITIYRTAFSTVK